MSQFVIDRKLYDTEKSEFLGKVDKWFKNDFLSRIYGQDVGQTFECDLYRTKKDNYFLVYKEGMDIIGQAISERSAKDLLMKTNLNAYIKHFGEIEEA